MSAEPMMRGRAGATPHMGARHYGGGDVYLRRRLIAGAVVIVLIVVIFLLVGGCQGGARARSSVWSAISFASASDEVAAGEGALRT